MTDSMDHATGLEKRELLAKAAGNDNPFDMKVFKRGPGTKENPNCIPSAFDARLVGCICEEDQTFVQWMWLHQVSKSQQSVYCLLRCDYQSRISPVLVPTSYYR